MSGADGLDEVTIADQTFVTLVEADRQQEFTWSPEAFGLSRCSLESLVIDGPVQSANLIRRVLAGEAAPARDIVVLNAAAALWVAQMSSDLQECAAKAVEAITSGRALELLKQLARLSHEAV